MLYRDNDCERRHNRHHFEGKETQVQDDEWMHFVLKQSFRVHFLGNYTKIDDGSFLRHSLFIFC